MSRGRSRSGNGNRRWSHAGALLCFDVTGLARATPHIWTTALCGCPGLRSFDDPCPASGSRLSLGRERGGNGPVDAVRPPHVECHRRLDRVHERCRPCALLRLTGQPLAIEGNMVRRARPPAPRTSRAACPPLRIISRFPMGGDSELPSSTPQLEVGFTRRRSRLLQSGGRLPVHGCSDPA